MTPGVIFPSSPIPDAPMSGLANIPQPHNEPVLSYAPGSAERTALKGALNALGSERPDIPAVVGGREIRSGVTQDVISPHCHARVLATLHRADHATIDAAARRQLTGIGGAGPRAPAVTGSTVVLKPAQAGALSNWLFYKLLAEAGLAAGVITLVPGDALGVSRAFLDSPDLAGVHFTG